MGGKPWDVTGNKNLLDDLDAIMASLRVEDDLAGVLMEHRDKDGVGGKSSREGKPEKIALTAQACDVVEDVTLADILVSIPEAPKDFFTTSAV